MSQVSEGVPTINVRFDVRHGGGAPVLLYRKGQIPVDSGTTRSGLSRVFLQRGYIMGVMLRSPFGCGNRPPNVFPLAQAWIMWSTVLRIIRIPRTWFPIGDKAKPTGEGTTEQPKVVRWCPGSFRPPRRHTRAVIRWGSAIYIGHGVCPSTSRGTIMADVPFSYERRGESTGDEIIGFQPATRRII